MFSQNGNQPILTDFRGCFPHAEDIEKNSSLSNLTFYLLRRDKNFETGMKLEFFYSLVERFCCLFYFFL
jgi:hypothetical protein